MSFVFCTSGQIIRRAGLYANTVAVASGSLLSDYCDAAEAFVSSATRRDWVTTSGTVGTNFVKILGDTVAMIAAKDVINYCMDGYTSRSEAQTMLDVLNDKINKNITLLDKDQYKEITG